MRKTIAGCLLAALAAVLALGAGPLHGEEAGSGGGRTYESCYLSHDETQILSGQVQIEEEEPEEVLQKLMGRINNKDKQGEGVALLPAGVQITTYSISGSLLELEFNEEYLAMNPVREFMARVGVVRTLLQVPGIASIRFRIGNQELLGRNGEPVGAMDWGDFLDLSKDDLRDYRYDSITLYYADKDGKRLVPETKNLYCKQEVSREYVILEQLAKGPIEKGHYPTISESIDIRSVVVAGDVAHVDLGRAFIDRPQENISSELAVASVVNSLIEGGAVERVQITVNGDPHAVMPGGLELYQYFGWNKKLVKDEKKEKEKEKDESD